MITMLRWVREVVESTFFLNFTSLITFVRENVDPNATPRCPMGDFQLKLRSVHEVDQEAVAEWIAC